VVSNRKKSAGAVSTGQEKYNWDSIRTGNHSAFSKADQCRFFNDFCGLKIKSEYPDF
jgi:hypothetical protein